MHFLIKIKHTNILKIFEIVESDSYFYHFYHITQRPVFHHSIIYQFIKDHNINNDRILKIKRFYTIQFLIAISYLNQSGLATYAKHFLKLNLSFNHRGYLMISNNVPKIDTFDYKEMEPLVN